MRVRRPGYPICISTPGAELGIPFLSCSGGLNGLKEIAYNYCRHEKAV